MADQYLTISVVANDQNMINRVTACAAVEGVSEPQMWTAQNNYQWASAPGWAEAWDYAVNTHPEEDYEPGADAAVITDGMILAQVQELLSRPGVIG